MTARSPIPPAFLTRPFARREALDAGVSPSRLRAADLSAPFRGVRTAGVPSDIESLCRSYLARMPRGHVFSHGTAARLYGLPLPAYLSDAGIHVTVPRGDTPPVMRGVVGHESDPDRMHPSALLCRRHPDGDLFELPVVSPAVVWAQLAQSLDFLDVIALGDAVVSRRRALATPDDLARVLEQWSGRRGCASMARAQPWVREDSLSRPESLLRVQAVQAGIPEPELNVVVHDSQGRQLTMADAVWPAQRVLAEYEGDGHRERQRFRRDITRFELYADADWSALRAHADDVFVDPNPFLGRLWRRLVARGWVPARAEPRVVARARP